jgi:hypothetical protein
VSNPADQKAPSGLTRRQLLLVGAAGLAMGSGLLLVPRRYFRMPQHAQVFVAKVDSYQSDIADAIIKGMGELGVSLEEVKGKRILLKPNLVETASGAPHINTHPLVLRGAVEALLKLGAGLLAETRRSGWVPWLMTCISTGAVPPARYTAAVCVPSAASGKAICASRIAMPFVVTVAPVALLAW